MITTAKERWAVIYKLEDDGAQSTFNGVAGGWSTSKVEVEGKNGSENAAYVLEEKGGLISGTPQACKLVTVEAGSEKECWSALKAVLGSTNGNGPALTVLASALKEQK